MITQIKKRDGRITFFDIAKISDAIFKAAQAAGGQDKQEADKLAIEVVKYLESQDLTEPTVEQIQNAVEKVLIETGHSKTAKEYIIYRANRTRIREMDTQLMKIYEDLTFQSAAESDIKRENANIDGDTAMGTMLKYGSEGAKQFYEMYILDPEHSKAHKEGDIHIHDMDFYTLTTTCCQIDIDQLFTGGFSTGHGFIREPQNIQSYASLACIAIQANQNDQHGGQSIPNFDYAMAKGVAKTFKKNYYQNLEKFIEIFCDDKNASEIIEKVKVVSHGSVPTLSDSDNYLESELGVLTEELGLVASKVQTAARKYAVKETQKATYQAMEALIHNLNTMHSRAGAQIPFSSINYGTDTSLEGKLVVEMVLKATEAGLGNGETPIFPIQIFKVKEGINFNPTDPNYDTFQLACKVSAKRLFPNFSFIDAPFNLQYYKEGDVHSEIAYMGCRTRVMSNNYDKSREIVTGRGNLSFTSINLPRLAIEANHDIAKFFDMLEEKVNLVADQLYHRFEIQCKKKVRNYPFLMGQGIWLDSEKLGPDDTLEDVLKHGTLTVGFIGLAEALVALTGKHHGESEECQDLGLRIVGFMRNMMDKRGEETGLNYSLIASPAEGLSGRFVKIDKKKYGVIPGVTDREYYTNSFHVPVYYKCNAFHKINTEAPYHAMTNAGHISYVELDGSPQDNLEAFEKIVRHMKESGIGYGSINHPVDRDPICGYTGIIGDTCPKCGRKEGSHGVGFDRIRRITGYLVGTLDRFNNAKAAEVRDRVKHTNFKGEA